MSVASAALTMAIPILLAALGGLIAERAGVLNIGLEGTMLCGALGTAMAAAATGSWLIGLACGIAVGLVAGLILGLLMVSCRGDQVTVGLLFNIFALGLTTYVYGLVTTEGAESVAVPPSSSVGWILGVVALAMVPVTYFVLYHTGLGLRLRASGESFRGAQAVGVDVGRVRLAAVSFSCVLAAIGGSYLVLAVSRTFVDNMTAGRGYIALAAIILGGWRPLGVFLSCLLFGVGDAVQVSAQSSGLNIPVEAATAFPYVLTLIGIAFVGRRYSAPAEEGHPMPSRK